MRTTLTIDDDLAAILERERVRKGVSLKEVVNSLLRRGLELEQLTPARPVVVTRPHDYVKSIKGQAISGWYFGRLRGMREHLEAAAHLATDAHLATLAMERGYTLCSTDADCARFPGLRWRNPLAG